MFATTSQQNNQEFKDSAKNFEAAASGLPTREKYSANRGSSRELLRRTSSASLGVSSEMQSEKPSKEQHLPDVVMRVEALALPNRDKSMPSPYSSRERLEHSSSQRSEKPAQAHLPGLVFDKDSADDVPVKPPLPGPSDSAHSLSNAMVSRSRSWRRFRLSMTSGVGGGMVVRQTKGTKKKMVLNPRSKSVMRWDLVVSALLLFTAIVTPFEVSFLETSINFLFFVNRFVDLCFLIDMAMQFFMPYQSPEGDWIADRSSIFERYIKGWFAVDFISVLPYDVIGLVLGRDATRRMKLLRFARLLRLVKLLRVLRARRMFRRWESATSINYSVLELIKFFTMMLFLSHWLACGWHMCSVLSECEDCEDGERSWIQHYQFIGDDSPILEKYIAAYYWASATVSTAGYGDVAPATNGERMFATVCALVGVTVYAYIIGAVCSIVASMSERNTVFYNTMDSLNEYMTEKNLTMDLKVKLRDFFRFLRYNAPHMDRQNLLQRMSPALRGEVSLQVNAKWIKKVPVFHDCSREFVVALSMGLQVETYSHSEEIVEPGRPADKMFIVEKGIIGVAGRVVSAGSSFGEDMIYSQYSRDTFYDAQIIRDWSARSLTNTALQVLDQDTLVDILDQFPDERAVVRRAVIKRAFRSAFTRYSDAVKAIWKEYPDARMPDFWDVIGQCRGDSTKLPAYYKGKKMVEELCQGGEGERSRELDRAASYIGNRYRAIVRRRGEEQRQEKARVRARGINSLKAFLAKHDFEKHQKAVEAHRLSIDMLDDLAPESLATIGIPLGDAVEILREHRKNRREEAEAQAEGNARRMIGSTKGRTQGRRPGNSTQAYRPGNSMQGRQTQWRGRRRRSSE